MTEPIIETRNLHKTFGAVTAAADVNVAVPEKQVLGIIGANGAGKTTFVNMVTGYLKPSRGQIFFRGRDITALPPREVTRIGICRSFQIAQLFPELTVLENLMVALAIADSRAPAFWRPLKVGARIMKAEAVLGEFGLAAQRDRATAVLPQGLRKLLDIAMAMVAEPAVLLLDEPTSGISADEKFAIMDTIMAVLKTASVTVLFVEHDMEIVERYSARVMAFYEGRVIADGPPGEVLASADVRRHVVGSELHRRP